MPFSNKDGFYLKSMIRDYVIGIDDTDAIGTKGTGAIADELRKIIEEKGYGEVGKTTRHQLLIHPDIRYTSHNSSMVFTAKIDDKYDMQLKETCCAHLKQESAEGSDPGLCIFIPDDVKDKSELVEFGYRAKNIVLKKEEAIYLAEKFNIFLQELSGDGSGVIGALAGAILRYCGNDGELKGGAKSFESESIYSAKQIRSHKNIDDIMSIDGETIPDDADVYVDWKVKPVLTNGKFIVFAKKVGLNKYATLLKNEMRDFVFTRTAVAPCEYYKPDVYEELLNNENSCLNCAFRRWSDKSFSCEKKRQ